MSDNAKYRTVEVLPVAQVIAHLLLEYNLPLVVGIKVHVEGIDDSIALVVDYDAAGLGSSGLPLIIRQDTFQPRWVLADVILRSQINDLFLWISLVFVQ